MSEWQNQPFAIDVKEGDSKGFCACGQTQNAPFCDGTHKGTEKTPYVEKFTEDKTIYVCGCRQSKNLPFCDGSHKTLS